MSNNHSTAVGGAASNLESVLRTAIHFKIQVVPRAVARLVTRWRPASCNCRFRLRRVALSFRHAVPHSSKGRRGRERACEVFRQRRFLI